MLPGARVLQITGSSRSHLSENLRHLRSRLSQLPSDQPTALSPLAPDGAAHRLTLVASTNGQAVARLDAAEKSLGDTAVRRIHDPSGVYYFGEPLGALGKVAFLFPGEGAQYPRMLGNTHPLVLSSRWFRLVERRLGRKLVPAENTGTLSPIAAGWVSFAVGLAFSELLGRVGVSPDMAVGHSFGEWSALLAMGTLDLDTDDDILESMAALDDNLAEAAETQRQAKAASIGVVAPDRRVIDRLLSRHAGRLFLAADNCVHQVMLAGYEDAVEQAALELTEQGAICERRPDAMAPHTPLMEAMAPSLKTRAAAVGLRATTKRVYSGATAAPFPADSDGVRRLLARQWIEPVRFREVIESMYRDGARIFVDVGPRGVLAGFVDDTLRGRPHVAITVNVAERGAEEQLCHALALLDAHHVRLDLRGLETSPVAGTDAAPPSVGLLPFIRESRVGLPNGAIEVSSDLDMEEDLFLRDHTFGGQISILDPMLPALPVVPFVVSLEMLAEAASALLPGLHVVGLRDVRAHRWMAADDDGKLPLSLSAKEVGPGRVRAEIRVRDGQRQEPFVEGTVLLRASRLATRPYAMPEGDKPHHHSRRTSVDYDGPHKRTFHGAVFRMVHELVRLDRTGVETLLRPPPSAQFFRSLRADRLLLHPVLIDGVGQSAAHWLESHFGRWVCVLPCMLGEVDFYGTPVAHETAVRCVVAARGVEEPLATCDASLIGPDGNLIATFKEWTDWTTFQPARYRAFSLSPLETFLSVPAEGRVKGTRRLSAFEPAFMESMGGIWLRVLRALVLGAEERRGWATWGNSDSERLERLMERIVAKDAVRSLLRARTGRPWGAADIDFGREPSVPQRISRAWGTLRVTVSRDADVWSASAVEEPHVHAA